MFCRFIFGDLFIFSDVIKREIYINYNAEKYIAIVYVVVLGN